MISLTTTYDLVPIGSAPAGQRAAIQAAKLGQRGGPSSSAVPMVGGVKRQHRDDPSKTLRAADARPHRAGRRECTARAIGVKEEIQISTLPGGQHVIGREREVVREQLRRNHVHLSWTAPTVLPRRSTPSRSHGDRTAPEHA